MQKSNAIKTKDFWQKLEHLLVTSNIILDRPKGSKHPHFPEVVYPLDYGYLENTSAADGGGIDIWRGSLPESVLDAIICTVDVRKRDTEIKLLLGCTDAEKELALKFHNNPFMAGMLISRAVAKEVT